MMLKNQDKLICKKIAKFLTPVVEEMDLELFDLTFRRESSGRVLRVTVDKLGVNVDHCTEVSRKLSAWLDEDETLIPYDQYSLEVSTPGLERPLRTIEDYQRFKDSCCSIALKEKEADGRKKYKGFIKEVEGHKISLFVESENKMFIINFDNIKKANLEIVL